MIPGEYSEAECFNMEKKIDDDLEILEDIRLMDLFPSIVSGRVNVFCDDRYVTFTDEDKIICKKVILDEFSDKRVGSTLIFINDIDETLEIVKKSENLFDTIEHLDDSQNKICNICSDIVISVLFRGGYLMDSMIESDQPMEDSTPITYAQFKQVPLKGEYQDVEYRYTLTFPDGSTRTGSKVLEAHY